MNKSGHCPKKSIAWSICMITHIQWHQHTWQDAHVTVHLKVDTAPLSLPVSISRWLRSCWATFFFRVWIHIIGKFCNVNKESANSCIRSIDSSQTSYILLCCSVFLLFLSDTQKVLALYFAWGWEKESVSSMLLTFHVTQYITVH